MSKVLINDTHLAAIAAAIRTKLGVADTYTPANMASAIQSITGGGSVNANHIYLTKTGITPVAGDVYLNVTNEQATSSSAETMSFIPNGYLDDYHWVENASYPQNLSNFYTDSSSGTYGTISLSSGAGTESYGYFTLDLSNKPSDLYSLLNLSGNVKLQKTATASEAAETYIALCIDKEEISGTKVALTVTSVTTLAIPQINFTSWTDLSNLTLKVSSTRGSTNPTYARYIRLYGADITISYTTTPEYYTTMTTEKYNGSSWQAIPFGSLFTSGNYYTL